MPNNSVEKYMQHRLTLRDSSVIQQYAHARALLVLQAQFLNVIKQPIPPTYTMANNLAICRIILHFCWDTHIHIQCSQYYNDYELVNIKPLTHLNALLEPDHVR